MVISIVNWMTHEPLTYINWRDLCWSKCFLF